MKYLILQIVSIYEVYTWQSLTLCLSIYFSVVVFIYKNINIKWLFTYLSDSVNICKRCKHRPTFCVDTGSCDSSSRRFLRGSCVPGSVSMAIFSLVASGTESVIPEKCLWFPLFSSTFCGAACTQITCSPSILIDISVIYHKRILPHWTFPLSRRRGGKKKKSMLCRVIQIITAAVAGISHNMTDNLCHIYLVTVLKEQIYSGANRERLSLRNSTRMGRPY